MRRARDTGYTLEHLADRLEVDELLANPPEAQILDFLGALEVTLETLPEPGPIALIGHQPYLGNIVAHLLGMRDESCAFGKGAVWWLRTRVRQERCPL